MDLDTYRRESREGWDRISGGWEKRSDWLAEQGEPLQRWLVEHLAPEPGDVVLELAAGPGDLGFRLAERAGRVLSTDFSPEMVEVARRGGQRRGVENVEHRVLDAEQMDLGDDAVDHVACRFGYMLMADPSAALSETRRVLRPGGRLVFAVWTTPDRNPWAAVPGRTIVERGHLDPPEPGTPGMFALGDTDRLRELVAAAGFADPVIEEVSSTFHYADGDDLLDALTSLAGGFSRALAALDDAERAATQAAILENMAPFHQEDGSYRAPASAWGVLAS